jgi:hypothetical protein
MSKPATTTPTPAEDSKSVFFFLVSGGVSKTNVPNHVFMKKRKKGKFWRTRILCKVLFPANLQDYL